VIVMAKPFPLPRACVAGFYHCRPDNEKAAQQTLRDPLKPAPAPEGRTGAAP